MSAKLGNVTAQQIVQFKPLQEGRATVRQTEYQDAVKTNQKGDLNKNFEPNLIMQSAINIT